MQIYKVSEKVDCRKLAGKRILVIISESIFLVVLVYICVHDPGKILSKYLKSKLDYEFDMTHKSNLALQSNMTNTHTEMHKTTIK